MSALSSLGPPSCPSDGTGRSAVNVPCRPRAQPLPRRDVPEGRFIRICDVGEVNLWSLGPATLTFLIQMVRRPARQHVPAALLPNRPCLLSEPCARSDSSLAGSSSAGLCRHRFSPRSPVVFPCPAPPAHPCLHTTAKHDHHRTLSPHLPQPPPPPGPLLLHPSWRPCPRATRTEWRRSSSSTPTRSRASLLGFAPKSSQRTSWRRSLFTPPPRRSACSRTS